MAALCSVADRGNAGSSSVPPTERNLSHVIRGVEFPSQPRSNFPVRTSVGTWLSLVEHSLGVRGVGSSNLPVPTNYFTSHIAPALRASGDREDPDRGIWRRYNS